MRFFKIVLIVVLMSNFSYAKEKKNLNINILSQQASQEFKHILLFFYMKDCPYCKRMRKFVFHDKKVKKLLENNFIFVNVDIDDYQQEIIYKDFKDSKIEFARKLKVDFYPTIFFIDDNNEIVYMKKGYIEKNMFKNILNYIKMKVYIDTDFQK